MSSPKVGLLPFAEMALEGQACSVAILLQDFDEARFRAHLLVLRAEKLNHHDVAGAAAAVVRALGPVGTPPGEGYGKHVLAMAHALNAITTEGLARNPD